MWPWTLMWLCSYEISKETNRQHFRENNVLEGKMPTEFLTRLKVLYEKWITISKKTKEDPKLKA